ncbi:trans-sialidase [Trypanosoma cruzi Dm28c]|uniref:Trans-sialidase n=2 Tax=Trypanosoma cruzi TaxID=5693 RepID=V5AN62_TRYCR|nr:trans-sialidase [Trypanosoma cruzi Dm28c]PBJ70758.1 trans-sialidase [Trypanosoma cruzi cruzi]PWV01933.1 putative trans-sialidase, Group V [Trypanosoma cruzi]
MLSRVAAVKAPRTHNRRRVTGSSGRRREGRESEPQRPNMSRHLFCSAVLLLIVVMMCDTGRAAQADVRASGPGSLLGKHFVWRDKKNEETVSLLYAPSLLDVNGKVFAVVEAQLEDEKNHFFPGIASEFLALSGETPKELATANVKAKTLEKCSSEEGKCPSQSTNRAGSQSFHSVHVDRPTTVVKENEIYMLAGTYIRENFAVCQGKADTASWGLLLVKGKVSEEQGKGIVWEDTDGLPCTSFVELYESWLQLTGSGGSGIKMEDGTLVFPLEAVKGDGIESEEEKRKNKKTVSLILYSSKDAKNWKLSKGMSAYGCNDPSVVEWGKKEDKKLMMMTACDDGRRRVYESGDMGEEWTEALGTLSRVWFNKQDEEVEAVRSGFITATIDGDEDNRNVMLVTLPVYAKEDGKKETGNGKGKLHLWLTDNTHIVDIGPVSEDNVAASSLLYRSAGSDNEKEELIALYEKKKGDGYSQSLVMVSVLLTEQLQRVKEVLSTWKKVDETVSKLCPSSDVESTSPGNACSTTVKITDGLVGFLSGNFSENTWRDEYLGVNATVPKKDGATKTSDGVKFTGAWAEWPVGSQGENQLYHFANYNFTLVATVSIDGEPTSGSVPLIGVRAGSDGVNKLMELSYETGKKWQALCGDGTTAEHSSTWEAEKTYQVAIVLRNGNHGSVYVDGKRVCVSVQSNLANTESKGISHFYIGGDGGSAENTAGDEDVSVTVSNVLLYNRPLTFTGGSADLEEDIASPSEAPAEQASSQQSRKKREAQQVPAASSSHAVGEATVDGGIVRGSGLLPLLLLLLGLWVFAAL